MLKSVPNTIPLFGSSLLENTRTFTRIVDSGQPVFLALDADAKKKSDRIAERFTAWGASVYIPDVYPYNDPGQMPSRKEFEVRYENAKPWTKSSALRERLRSLC